MGLINKGSKLYSILNLKCPRCHEGSLFDSGTFSFQKSFDMPNNCKKCGQEYYLEPGFYYGAMFISYAMTGFFCFAFVGLCMFGFDLSVNASFIWLLFVLAIFFVWIYRTARAIWINFHVKYDPDIKLGDFSDKDGPTFVNRNF